MLFSYFNIYLPVCPAIRKGFISTQYIVQELMNYGQFLHMHRCLQVLGCSCYLAFLNPANDSCWVLWFHVGCLCVRLSSASPYFASGREQVKSMDFCQSWICILLLGRSNLELLIDKFCQFFFYEFSAEYVSIFVS